MVGCRSPRTTTATYNARPATYHRQSPRGQFKTLSSAAAVPPYLSLSLSSVPLPRRVLPKNDVNSSYLVGYTLTHFEVKKNCDNSYIIVPTLLPLLLLLLYPLTPTIVTITSHSGSKLIYLTFDLISFSSLFSVLFCFVLFYFVLSITTFFFPVVRISKRDISIDDSTIKS